VKQIALRKGPAYGRCDGATDAADWPTYRGNPGRSGVTASVVPSALEATWQVPLSGRLTPPTVASGKVFVASTDEHTLLTLDAASGDTLWTFIADARVDSPPTFHDGQVLFGGRDGVVYALRASDGVLAWRFQGGRNSCRISSNGQLESAWPIHGSVLVDQDVAYFTAGRSSYLDGGIDLYRLNPRTGSVLSATNLSSPDPETGKQPAQYNANQMPGARSDILVADHDNVYLRDLAFSKDGEQREDRVPHLFTLTDFRDDSWTHRSYWVFADEPSIATGCSGRNKNLIYGRLLIYDNDNVYGYARKSVHWSNAFQDGDYHLFSRPIGASGPGWSASVPIQVQAFVRAGDTLFVAGPVAETDEQTSGLTSQPGGLLIAYHADDGSELGRHELSAPPVFDGMAAAQGKLYLVLSDASVLCLGGE